jgi:hypothetical protein
MNVPQPKKPYQPPGLKSVKVFLSPLLGTSGAKHPHTKRPFQPFR